mmetsp:Transcript_6651/g.10353  ORF Transcript_6651/g.10353 Transcript_6651/m.10353 type:complete len:228 (+) Transcript_6651:816-1499(+)
MVEEEFGPDSPEVVRLLWALLSANNKLGNFEVVIELASRLLLLKTETKEKTAADCLVLLGSTYGKIGWYDNAILTLKAAGLSADSDYVLGQSLRIVAAMYGCLRMFEDAAATAERAFNIGVQALDYENRISHQGACVLVLMEVYQMAGMQSKYEALKHAHGLSSLRDPLPPILNMYPKACASCRSLASSKNLQKCGKCQSIWYCSKECQKNDWKRHKEFCKMLSKTV